MKLISHFLPKDRKKHCALDLKLARLAAAERSLSLGIFDSSDQAKRCVLSFLMNLYMLVNYSYWIVERG